MKIKFTDSVAGANFAYRRGEIKDLRVDLALGFVKAGQAVRHEEEPPVAALPEQVETAVAAPAPETADSGRRARRRLGGLFPRG